MQYIKTATVLARHRSIFGSAAAAMREFPGSFPACITADIKRMPAFVVWATVHSVCAAGGHFTCRQGVSPAAVTCRPGEVCRGCRLRTLMDDDLRDEL